MWDFKRIFRAIRFSLGSGKLASGIEDEFNFHIDMATDEWIRQGCSPEEARRRAKLQFGSLDRYKNKTFEVSSFRWLRNWWLDLRFSFRSLMRSPSFLILSIATLAISVTTCAIVLAALHQAFLVPLPHAQPQRIMTIWETLAENPSETLDVSPGNYVEWHKRSVSFDHLGIAEPSGMNVLLQGKMHSFSGLSVSQSFVNAIAITPILGRGFQPEEYAVSNAQVALLSHGAWQTYFASDEAVIGTDIDVDGALIEVIGVLPPDMGFPPQRDFWIPWQLDPGHNTIRQGNWMYVAGRLRSGVTTADAQGDLDRIAKTLAAEFPDTNSESGIIVRPLKDHMLFGIDRALLGLSVACVLFFLATCATVTGMYVTRLYARGPELAVRGAVGANPLALGQSVSAELLIISAFTLVAAIGLLVPYLELLRTTIPEHLPVLSGLAADKFMVSTIVLLVPLITLGCGLWPAKRLIDSPLANHLRNTHRHSGALSSANIRNKLIVAQVAVATVLLIGAALFTQSLNNLQDNRLGFASADRISIQIFADGFSPGENVLFFDEAVDLLQSDPDVAGAATVSALPFHPTQIDAISDFQIVGHVASEPDRQSSAYSLVASPGYFELMEIPVLSGRGFSDFDNPDSARVAVINDTMAQRFWPDRTPVGERLHVGIMGPPFEWEIVGVVGDVLPYGFASAPRPEIYVPHAQTGIDSMTMVVHSLVPPDSITSRLQSSLTDHWPRQAISHVASLQSLIAESVATRTFAILVLNGFTIGAVILAILGIYSLTAYSVTLRRHELGIRMALGADPRSLRNLIIGQGFRLTVSGICIGTVCAALLANALQSLFYHVAAVEPLLYVGAITAILVTTSTAAWIPAWRATLAQPFALLGTR